ncbi:MAG: DUF938 domain-containing protein [Cyanobacteria bacterium P01_C01_bin.69]
MIQPNNLPDGREYASATERNREPILAVLRQVLPDSGTVLEIASGTGEHATFLAPRLSHLYWQPSEADESRLNSIRAWSAFLPADNVRSPIQLNVMTQLWPIESEAAEAALAAPITAIVNINMIHISPWEACQQLMAGAERILPPGGVLYLYGPYKREGKHTAPSNEAFDLMLRDRNSSWGIRDLEAVCDIASEHQLQLSQVVDMPANNLSVVLYRQ